MRLTRPLALLCLCCLVSSAYAAPERKARGVVLFIGDGMGIATVTAARIHKGFLAGTRPPAAARLNLDRAPRSCLVQTWSADNIVTDSAASMTAMVTGVKVINGALAARATATGGIEKLMTLLEIAESRGLSTGVVTTTSVTHGTPAATYAHILKRGDQAAITAALVPGVDNPRLGDGIEVVLGGGRSHFIARPAVLEALSSAGYHRVETAQALEKAVAGGAGKILGLFAELDLEFAAQRASRAPQQPTLAQMTRAALEVLRRDPRGYFLVVEGGRIDHAHHMNNSYLAIGEMLAFDEALGVAVDSMGDDDVFFVTADHDHTMVIAGYAPVSQDVFSQAGGDANGDPYATLLYADGPGALKKPPASLPSAEVPAADRIDRAGVPLEWETHAGMDVPLYVFAPPAVRNDLPASIDNTEIFRRLRSAILAIE